MMWVRQYIQLTLLPLFLILLSCGEKDMVELSVSEKKLADSLYSVQLESLDKMLDSICVAQYDSIYRVKYDSILDKRLKNLQKLLPDEK